MPTKRHTSHRKGLLSTASLALLSIQSQIGNSHAELPESAGNISCDWHLADPQECADLLRLDCNWMGCNVAFNQTYSPAYNETVGSWESGFWQETVSGEFICNSWDPNLLSVEGYLKESSCGPSYPGVIAASVLLSLTAIPLLVLAGIKMRDRSCQNTCSLTSLKKRFLNRTKTQGSDKDSNEKDSFEAEMA